MRARALPAVVCWRIVDVLLQALSLAVPAAQRESWHNEWKGELWQARAASAKTLDGLRFAAGAFPDAICLGWEGRHEPFAQPMPASRFLCALALFATLTTAIAVSLPSVRAEFRQSRWKSPEATSVLFLPNADNEAKPTITPERFMVWKDRAHFVQELGYYQIAQQNVSVQGRSAQLRIAHVAGDLAAMIGESDLLQQGRDAAPERLVVSRRAWQRHFGAEALADSKFVQIDGRFVRISGVADLEDSGLPGSYDAWLFDTRPMQAEVAGFVVGRFATGTATNPYFGFQHFGVQETPEFEISGLAVPLAARKVNPWSTLTFGLALSLLALPATTPLGFGQRVRADRQASVWQVLRRWLFMASKCVLWAISSSGMALIVASGFSRADWRTAVATRLLVAFTIMLVGLRWLIQDQRGRCPVCLHRLTHPAQVGEPSRNFLSWSGTELVCELGHGFMHVPAHATSWFSAQRWLALDSSWQFLFAQKR